MDYYFRAIECAKDISYASSANTRLSKVFIGFIENLLGRQRLIRRAIRYAQYSIYTSDFWTFFTEAFGVKIKVLKGSVDNIPKNGPLIIVCNHPFGVLDGLILGKILSDTRPDFKILAHKIFEGVDELDEVILPINFEGSKSANQQNIKTRRDALAFLKSGGAIGIFPAGTVSTASRKGAPVSDTIWRNFTAKLIKKTDTKVVPILFLGSNSQTFQWISRLNYTLRSAMFINEFKRKIDNPVGVVIGEPLGSEKILEFGLNSEAIMEGLRSATYALSPYSETVPDYCYEFEDRYKDKLRGKK
ncbi:MAG: lysophospholipid acyltransferase family protein [Rhodobacteraceae bacterium]|nr:lysophospholipid acyltransferase family protein [Paracoccaceae bacterium]